MREKIHPKWYPEAKVTCLSCGTVWTVGATLPEKKIDICSNCHPFYTGQQRIVDTEGQVDRFYKRLQQRDQRRAEAVERTGSKASPDVSIEELGLGKRFTQILADEGLTLISQVIDRLDSEGDDGLLKVPGIGRKVLADIKKGIRARGFELAGETAEGE
ncbi:MAG: 50S ribosomal protein L31 [Anaerolineae bacterium]|nr:50S ribosomal protein L31 [Anaerolineae bacterium]